MPEQQVGFYYLCEIGAEAAPDTAIEEPTQRSGMNPLTLATFMSQKLGLAYNPLKFEKVMGRYRWRRP